MLSHRITLLRKKAGMSQADLAKLLNISTSAAGMYEQGRRFPSIEILVTLSTIFDVSLDYLITGSEYHRTESQAPQTNIPEECPCSICYWKSYLDKI